MNGKSSARGYGDSIQEAARNMDPKEWNHASACSVTPEFQGDNANKACAGKKLILEERLHIPDYCYLSATLCYNEMTGHV
jgi:hypothetical protein